MNNIKYDTNKIYEISVDIVKYIHLFVIKMEYIKRCHIQKTTPVMIVFNYIVSIKYIFIIIHIKMKKKNMTDNNRTQHKVQYKIDKENDIFSIINEKL